MGRLAAPEMFRERSGNVLGSWNSLGIDTSRSPRFGTKVR